MNAHRKLDAWNTWQLRRAAVSAAANIAEGYARWGLLESGHGVSIALGSPAEVDTLITIAEDEGYLAGSALTDLAALRERARQVTWGLAGSYGETETEKGKPAMLAHDAEITTAPS